MCKRLQNIVVKLVWRAASLVGLLALVGCLDSPERGNPLDPRSDDFVNAGAVSGTTLSFYPPFSPIGEVEIRLEPGPYLTRSDADGNFELAEVPVGAYQITARKAGFLAPPDSVEVRLGQTTRMTINLDGLPVVRDFTVTSCHIDRWWPQTALRLLEVSAQVEDPDGPNDIATVHLSIPGLGFEDTLMLSQTPGVYVRTIREERLPGRSIHEVPGQQIVLRATDRAGFENTSEPKVLARIIEEVPTFAAPILETVNDSHPTLSWEPVSLPFDFTYRVEVARVDFNITNTVWIKRDIEPTATSIAVGDSLPPGDYFWTIGVEDGFGNWSRSREASFTVN